MAREFRYEWRWRLDSPPEALWPLIADTDRFNRDTHLPPVERLTSAQPLPPGLQRLRFHRFGIPVEWDEQPFEWVRPRSFGVLRRYVRGPVREMRVRVELTPDSGGTALSYAVTATPANSLGYLAVPLQIGRWSARDFDRAIRGYDALAARRASVLDAPPVTPPRVNRARLDALLADLAASSDKELSRRLGALIAGADDLPLTRLRPYELAAAWGAPRRSAMELCLEATRIGLLDLQWDLLCPLCRGVKQRAPALAEVSANVHCDACRIDFTVNFDSQVELTFRPNPAVRVVEAGDYCVGGPEVTPHIALQQQLGAGESRELDVELEPGRYRLRAQAITPGMCSIEITVQHPQETVSQHTNWLVASGSGWEPSGLQLSPSCRLGLRNDTATGQLLVLERTAWSDLALTAAEVTTSQRFRDLFAREMLRPGENIRVGSLTVVFTDLKGSTGMYRSLGDGPAFGRVMDHFAVVRAAVDAQGGAVIKTMGDAVLACFTHPAPALRAMLAAQRELAGGPDALVRQEHLADRSVRPTEPLPLKVGIHLGPCIAVTLNERLDYFGTTMNVAARLASLSDGADIVITQAVASDPEVAAMLGTDLASSAFSQELRGLDEQQFDLLRVTPA